MSAMDDDGTLSLTFDFFLSKTAILPPSSIVAKHQGVTYQLVASKVPVYNSDESSVSDASSEGRASGEPAGTALPCI